MSKADLRRWARELPPPTDRECAAVVDGLGAFLVEMPPASVLVYMSMPGELPADRLIVDLGHLHRFFITRTPAKGYLSVHPVGAPMEMHPFGYLQPTVDALSIDPEILDFVVAPGLSFDRLGNRLGWGRGYYDQLLASVGSNTARIGMTLERRVVEQIPAEPHDVVMTHLATELGVVSLAT